MRLSRDKVNKLAHVVTDALAERSTARLCRRPQHGPSGSPQSPGRTLNQEARIDQSARQKIESQKRTILEGSQEWDILYRKYYNEEVKKLGI